MGNTTTRSRNTQTLAHSLVANSPPAHVAGAYFLVQTLTPFQLASPDPMSNSKHGLQTR
jgi:hypothetical protein